MTLVTAVRSGLGSSRLSLLHLRLGRGTFAAGFVVVAATAFLFSAMPRAFSGFADDALRHDVRAAPPEVRDVSVTAVGRLPSLAAAAERGRRELARLPAPLPSLLRRSTTLVDTARLAPSLPPLPAVSRYLTIRTGTGIEKRVAVVRGRLPRASSGAVEVALSEATARALHVSVGERFAAQPDTGEVQGYVPPDPLAQSVPAARQRPFPVQVVGIVRARDARSRLARPVVSQTPDLQHTYVFGYAAASPDAYAALLRASAPVPLRYEWRGAAEAGRFHDADVGAIRSAAARLEADSRLASPLATTASTRLGDLLGRYAANRSQAETLLAIAAIGLLACAAAAIGLLAALGAQRRRHAVELMRSRGGSPSQVVAGQLAEGALLAVPAAALGFGIAVAVTGGALSFAAWLAAAIAGVGLAAHAAGGIALARRPIESSPRDDVVLPRLSPRRLVLEGLVVVAAALGVVLLRRRGLDPETAAAGFDPYLAAVPVLLGLAAALLVLRAYPLPLRLLARSLERRRGLVAPLALARSARAPAVGALPLVVLILSLAVACFAAIVLRSVDAGQERQAWQRVGADVRVDVQGALPQGADGVRAYVGGTFLAAGAGGVVGPQLLAVEPDAYGHVLAAGPEAAAGRALARLGGGAGGLDALAVGWRWGDELEVAFAGRQVRLHVVARRASFPAAAGPTAVVSLPALQRALGERPVAPNRLYLDGAEAPHVPGARVQSRAAALADVRDAPLVAGTTDGFRIAIGLAAAYAALAVVLSIVLTTRSRSRDLAYLATLGLSPRQAVGLAALELAPLAVVSAAAGAALGIGVALLVEPGLDLSFFTGASSSPLVLPSGMLAVLAAGLVGLVAVSALAAAAAALRTDPTRALRLGENR